MQQAEYNYQDFSHSGQNEADKALLVKFFIKARPDKEATNEQGRPIFKDVEYVDIKISGNRSGGACRPATEGDKQRFPEHYRAFKDRVDVPVIGTPLSEWPQIGRSQIEELSFMNVKTVENLANMADSNISSFIGGYTLKQKAIDWLASAGETALIARNIELDKKVNVLEDKVERLLAALEESDSKPIEKPSLVAQSVKETTVKKIKAKAKRK